MTLNKTKYWNVCFQIEIEIFLIKILDKILKDILNVQCYENKHDFIKYLGVAKTVFLGNAKPKKLCLTLFPV